MQLYGLLTLVFVRLTTSKCFMPSGGTRDNLIPCPLIGSAEAASCCFANHYCLSNGLCMEPISLTFYRGGCTSSTYDTSGCPKVCDHTDILGADPTTHNGVWNCGSARFACNGITNCQRTNFTVVPGKIVWNTAASSDLGPMPTSLFPTSSTPSTTTHVLTSVNHATITVTDTSTSCSTATNGVDGISVGAATGLGVGIGAPLALVVGALSWMLFRENRKARMRSQALNIPASRPGPKPEDIPVPQTPVTTRGPAVPPRTPSSTTTIHELMSSQLVH
ncbi:hypothetical protein CCHL11_06163 [Colletotrichum chlorophyti]|uniref:Uncharacterized protein n=1 Tax=Colletotrichum chlorophyti TaxID=708187 RepID=A0A1Q8RTA1_9PEZI|nr:hypothetical protein CCHL11_06163 [Colletotrichum chlorophyti]